MPDIRCIEGEVKSAQPGDNLIFPSVTSCLTVTCVTRAGKKWGAHMSLLRYQQNRGRENILWELGAQMQAVHEETSVDRVWIVGVLSSWTASLRSRAQADPPLDPANDEHRKEACSHLSEVLQLTHLDATKSGADADYDFVFRDNGGVGDVVLTAGISANTVGLRMGAGGVVITPDDYLQYREQPDRKAGIAALKAKLGMH